MLTFVKKNKCDWKVADSESGQEEEERWLHTAHFVTYLYRGGVDTLALTPFLLGSATVGKQQKNILITFLKDLTVNRISFLGSIWYSLYTMVMPWMGKLLYACMTSNKLLKQCSQAPIKYIKIEICAPAKFMTIVIMLILKNYPQQFLRHISIVKMFFTCPNWTTTFSHTTMHSMPFLLTQKILGR